MAKKSALIVLVFVLVTFFTAAAMAEDHPEHVGADIESDTRAKAEISTKMENSRAYLSAAEKIVSQGSNEEAAALLKNAHLMLKEGEVHYESGQHTYSLEDLIEAIQMATHAMVLASNEQNLEMRDLVMYEESVQSEKRDAERKESIIRKNTGEAVIFINTAERILQRFPDEAAFRKLVEAQDSLVASRAALEENNHDGSLEELNRSYKLATNAITDAYKAHGINFVPRSQPRTNIKGGRKGVRLP